MDDPSNVGLANSIKNLQQLLYDVVHAPGDFIADESLIVAFRSQGALAKLTLPQRGIVATSLNTVKRHSEKWIVGGFDALNVSRELALAAMIRAKSARTAPPRRTKGALIDQLRMLKLEISQVTQDNLLLTGAIGTAIKLMREYSEKSKDAATLLKCEKDIADLLRLFSLKCQVVVRPDVGDDDGPS